MPPRRTACRGTLAACRNWLCSNVRSWHVLVGRSRPHRRPDPKLVSSRGEIEVAAGSEKIDRGNNSRNEHDAGDHDPKSETFLDDGARTIAVAVDHEGDQVETHSARDE